MGEGMMSKRDRMQILGRPVEAAVKVDHTMVICGKWFLVPKRKPFQFNLLLRNLKSTVKRVLQKISPNY